MKSIINYLKEDYQDYKTLSLRARGFFSVAFATSFSYMLYCAYNLFL